MRDCASVAMGVTGGSMYVECNTIKKKKLSDVYFCEECIQVNSNYIFVV